MKIALLHYHLQTGGVTTVIQRQAQALQGKCEMLVLTGDRAKAKLPCPVVEIPEIGYDRSDKPSPPPEAIVERILKSIFQIWPDGCDVLHIHNPTLAKNRHLITCINLLQAGGTSLFLQIHDFAEDGRPQAYSHEAYPRDCHYGVINARDERILLSAGLKAAGVHLVPNAIESLPVDPVPKLEPCVVYPVRAIRRKNIGEAILLSLFLAPGKTLHITQPPTSAVDTAVYADWQVFVNKHDLNVRFETGREYGFPALVAAADSMVTTSITEGFGFSFLEPWTASKMLWGRRLGAICQDFEQKGLGLNSLYDELTIPLDWFSADGLIKDWRRVAVWVNETYGTSFAPEQIDCYLDGLKKNGEVDFGILSETYQRQVLERLLTDPDARHKLVDMNPKVLEPEIGPKAQDLIENNRRLVLDNYDLAQNGERLLMVYKQVIHHPVQHRIDKTALLDAFLDMKRFSLLKWGANEF